MTAPLPSPNDIAAKLIWLGEALRSGAKEIGAADDALTRAKGRYQKARAKAVLLVANECRSDKSILAAEREAKVDEATYQEWLDVEVAEAALRKAKEDQKARYADVDLVRSLNAGLRAEISLSGAS
jgi:predicted outer membrane protein